MAQLVAEDELSRVLELLRESKPLSRISDTFKGRFDRADLFRVGCALCVLVEDDLLTSSERLAAFYLLADGYSHNGSNPFVPFFLHNLERKAVMPVEKKFVGQLLMSLGSSNNNNSNGLSKDVGKRTPAAVLVEYERNSVGVPSSSDLEQINKSYVERTPQVPGARVAGVRPVVSTAGLIPTHPLSASDILKQERTRSTTPVPPSSAASASSSSSTSSSTSSSMNAFSAFASSISIGEEEEEEEEEGVSASTSPSTKRKSTSGLCLQSFEPVFVRPAPPMMLPFKEEIIWLNPTSDDTMNRSLMWDRTLCKDPSKSAALRELMSKAFKGPLAPNEQKSILSVLEESAKIVSVFLCFVVVCSNKKIKRHNQFYNDVALFYTILLTRLPFPFSRCINLDCPPNVCLTWLKTTPWLLLNVC